MWDAESGEIVATMPGHGKSARHMQLSSDGKALLTQDFEAWFASGTPKTGPCPPRMTSTQRRRDPSNSHRTGPASRSWKRNVSASSPYPTLDQLAEFPLPIKGVHLAAFNPDGNLLAVTAADGKARVWNLA